MVENAQWANAESTVVHAKVDGIEWRHIHLNERTELQGKVQLWIDAGNEPAPFEPPASGP
jgi:hypothetical protein